MTAHVPSKKPLGQKSYGHIPHFPGSRMGPGDHKCSDGQFEIATVKSRKGDMIIVQEKLDGSNVAIAKENGAILPLIRAGYLAVTSPYKMHHDFAEWVARNIARFEFLNDGERLCGEWLTHAHGTRYKLPHEPFVAFDLIHKPHKRATFLEFELRVGEFVRPRLIYAGPSAFSLGDAIDQISVSGHGAIDEVEGVVYRVETEGVVNFLAKWVRPNKIDGKYLDSGILNEWPSKEAA